jgi:hypothetical protein
MLRKKKILILIPAMLLIPILLGMIPLNMAHKLANGGPFAHCEQARCSNHCPFNSLVSHDDSTVASLDSTPLGQEPTPALHVQAVVPGFVRSNVTFDSIPLRC